MKFLLENGLKLNKIDIALSEYLKNDNIKLETIKFLVENGAPVEHAYIVLYDEGFPLDYIICNREIELDKEILNYLVDHGLRLDNTL